MKAKPRVLKKSVVAFFSLWLVCFAPGAVVTAQARGVMGVITGKVLDRLLLGTGERAAFRGVVGRGVKRVPGVREAERGAKALARQRIIKKLPPSIKKTFAKGRYTQVRLPRPLKVYRYHGDYNREPRKFAFVTDEELFTEPQVRQRLAIPTIAAGPKGGYRHIVWVSRYEIPKGTLISRGMVAPLGRFPGGGWQIVVEDLQPQWRIATTRLKDFRQKIARSKR